MRLGMALCASALVSSAGWAAEESAVWQYIHPEASILVGGDFKKVQSSPLWRQLKQELAGAQVKTDGEAVFEMVDRFLLSAPELPTAERTPVLICIEGTFDRARLRKALAPGTGVERFMGVDLFVPPKIRKTDMLLAVLNDHLGLIGTRDSLESALKGTKVSSPLIERAKALNAHNAIWTVSDAALVEALASPSSPAVMRDVDHLDLAIALEKGLDVSIYLGAKTPAAARSIAAMAESAKYLVSSQSGSPQPGAGLLKEMNVVVAQNEVRLSWFLPAAEVQRSISDLKAGLMEMGMKAMASMAASGRPSLGWLDAARPTVKMPPQPAVVVAAASQAPPNQPEKRTIKIVGLDNGDKEVVYTTGKQ